MVGQQPFGGARASGANDKAGSLWNLARWISPRTIKENFTPPIDWRYPFMEPTPPRRICTVSDLFQPRDPRDVGALIAESPLAWVVSTTPQGMRGTTLPLLAHLDCDGMVVGLEGHFARSNPQLESLRANPHALILFLGPHSYISPSWITNRTWAPTWNFAHAQFQAELSFFDESEAIAAHLRKLVDAMERGRPNAWSPDEMGARFASLARGVVGFTAHLKGAEHRFKLGQDERPEVFAKICEALGDSPLAMMMREQKKS